MGTKNHRPSGLPQTHIGLTEEIIYESSPEHIQGA
jgi:hypothetical protein